MLNINPLRPPPTVQTVTVDCPICGTFSFDAPEGWTITPGCFRSCPGDVYVSRPVSKKLSAPDLKVDRRSTLVLK